MIRDRSGRFVKDHAVVSVRDKKTGRFVKKISDDALSRYLEVRDEVDTFLKYYDGAT